MDNYERSRRSLPPGLIHSTSTSTNHKLFNAVNINGAAAAPPAKIKSKKSKLSESLLNALRLNPKARTTSVSNVSASSSIRNTDPRHDKLVMTTSINDDNNNIDPLYDSHVLQQSMNDQSSRNNSIMHQSWHAHVSHSTQASQPVNASHSRLQAFTAEIRKRLSSHGVTRRSTADATPSIMVTSGPVPLTSNNVSKDNTLPVINHQPVAHHRANSTTCMNSLNDVALTGMNWRYRGGYRRLGKLGEGSYATVYKCIHEPTNAVVALKEIRLQAEEGLPFTAIREVSLLKGLNHANIVMLHDIILERSKVTLVFEYLETDLSKHLECHPVGLHPHNVKLYLYQLLRGLAFCHDRKILHRDLKPQNLLLNRNGELKLADFGLARARSVPSRTFSHEVVTLWYRPPDVLLGSTTYNTCLDMWGVGCIFAEMITGCVLFAGQKHVNDQLYKIFCVLGVPTPADWPGCITYKRQIDRIVIETEIGGVRIGPKARVDWFSLNPKFFRIQYCESLLGNLLKINPNERLSARDAMEHPYFKNLPDKCSVIPKECSLFVLPGLSVVPEPFQPMHTAC